MSDGNNNGSSGGENTTDWGQVIGDVGGLVDELFDGSFWDFIAGLGCMSSDYKLRYLKDKFPAAVNAIRSKSGVDMSMTDANVNDFSKRLKHHYTNINNAIHSASSCRKTYTQKYAEMLSTYINELHNLLLASGFVEAGTQNVSNYSQSDLGGVNGGYGFTGSESFSYKTYRQVAGNNHTTVNPPEYGGGGVFSPGTYSPSLSSFNVMNYALGGLMLFGLYTYAKDNKMIK